MGILAQEAKKPQGEAQDAAASGRGRVALALGVIVLFALAAGMWLAHGQRLFAAIMTGAFALCL